MTQILKQNELTKIDQQQVNWQGQRLENEHGLNVRVFGYNGQGTHITTAEKVATVIDAGAYFSDGNTRYDGPGSLSLRLGADKVHGQAYMGKRIILELVDPEAAKNSDMIIQGHEVYVGLPTNNKIPTELKNQITADHLHQYVISNTPFDTSNAVAVNGNGEENAFNQFLDSMSNPNVVNKLKTAFTNFAQASQQVQAPAPAAQTGQPAQAPAPAAQPGQAPAPAAQTGQPAQTPAPAAGAPNPSTNP